MRDRVGIELHEVEHDSNTLVLVEEIEDWRRLIWMRKVICEKDGLSIKKKENC